jgi:AcrR family transcriptional regulator
MYNYRMDSLLERLSGGHLLRKMKKGERTRLKIIEAAVACYSDRGFDGASFADIAGKAGVNRGLIAHYFGSKQALIEEALTHVVHGLRDFNQRFIPEWKKKVPEPMECWGEATFTWAKEIPDYAGYLILCIQRSQYDPAVAQAIRKVFQDTRASLAGIIRDASNELPYRITSPEIAALQIHSLVVGHVVMALTMGRAQFDEYHQAFRGVVRRTMGRPD